MCVTVFTFFIYLVRMYPPPLAPKRKNGRRPAKGAAPTSETEADKAFKEIDSNGDGMLSADEIKAAIAKHGKLCKAKWSDAKITETICKFDVEYAAQHFEPGPVA